MDIRSYGCGPEAAVGVAVLAGHLYRIMASAHSHNRLTDWRTTPGSGARTGRLVDPDLRMRIRVHWLGARH